MIVVDYYKLSVEFLKEWFTIDKNGYLMVGQWLINGD